MNMFLSAMVRHLLTLIGGGLATKGYVDSGTWETIAGGIMAAVGVAMSLWDKHNRKDQNQLHH